MSILNYNTALQSNNTDLQAILDAVNELSDKIKYTEVEWSENEDAIISGTISSYTNNRITNIGSDAFKNCYNLTTVSFPACTTIGGNAFDRCSSLTTVSFPACTTIGDSAFVYCKSLTIVNFPACITIGYNAFNYCSSLTTTSFPACITINRYAFDCCSSLTTISFPACITIDRYAFNNCYHLKSLYLTGSSLCKLSNSNAFSFTPIGGYSYYAGTFGSIYVPTSLLTFYQTATNWTYFSSRFVGIDMGGGDDNIITFTIDGTEYQAEEGMTWGEWINSEYNTLGFYDSYGEIALDTGLPDPEFICYQDLEYCKTSELIINSYSYIISA